MAHLLFIFLKSLLRQDTDIVLRAVWYNGETVDPLHHVFSIYMVAICQYTLTHMQGVIDFFAAMPRIVWRH